jgi:pimeloyl-ACP methyl ester carboxylesterase
MTYRIPDQKARELFSLAGVPLVIETIHVNGHSLHYAKTGSDDKPTLFFVHGSPGSWMKFVDYLSDATLLTKFRMVSVDRPGFGYSDFGKGLNLGEQSAIISVLLKQLQNGQPVYIAGPSFGGPLVVRLAADNPGMFSGMVLMAAALDPLAERPEKWRALFFYFPFRNLVPGAWRTSNREIWFLKKDLISLRAAFIAVRCPVYILHGDMDRLVPLSNTDYAKKMLVHAKNVSVTILRGSGHFIVKKHFADIKKVLMELY